MYVKSVLVSAILCANLCAAVIDGSHTNTITEPPKNTSERAGRSLHKDCNGSLSAKCLKIHVLTFIEDLSSRDELTLLPGLSIVKENRTLNSSSPDELAAELSRQFPGRPEDKLNRFLVHRLRDYLDEHSLKFRLLDPKSSEEAMYMVKSDSAFTGRKKNKGGGGGGGGLMAAGMMMAGTLGAAALGALALLAAKALMAALMSLLLSAIVGLKGQSGGGKTTYEIHTKPEISHHHSHSQEEIHEHDHGHGHHGYRRAFEPDPYNSYMPYGTSNASS